MEATLVVIGGKTNRSEIKLKLPSVFGRGRDADITIAHPAVSRQHCRLEEVEGALVLRDNDSTNGVYFGKQRVKEMVIRPGDLFSIGPLTFRAEYDHDGEFPDIGEPRPDHSDEATIQFSPGDDLDFSAPTPPDGTPMPGARAKKPADDELDLGLGEPEEAAAAADSGLDFMSAPEPAAAAAVEPEAKADDDDDFMSAFQEDDQVGAGLADSTENEADDPLADLGFDEPSAEVEEPPPAKKPAGKHKSPAADDPLADLGFDEPSAEVEAEEVEEPAPAKKPAAKHKPAAAADESADEMFNFASKESASDALGENVLGDDPLSDDAFVDAEAPASASAEDELDFDLLGSSDEVAGDSDEDTTEVAVSPLKAEKPSASKPPAAPIADDDEPAADDEIEFDTLGDMPEPAGETAGALGDLDDLGGDDEPPAKAAADKGKGHKGASAKEAKGKDKSAKGKDAKKGWWPFGKNEKKPSRKSDERKPAGKQPAAAELPDLEPAAASEPEAFEPDVFEPDASEPDALEMEAFEPVAFEPDAPSAADEEMPDFFEAEPAPPAKAAKPTKPASVAKPAKPAASAEPAAKSNKAPPPAKKPESRPAAKPAASKPPADEPDLDFSGSGSASGKPAEDDDGLNDFFADLGL